MAIVSPRLGVLASKLPVLFLLWLALVSLSACNFGRSAEPATAQVFATPTPMRVFHTVQHGPVVDHLTFSGRVGLAVQEDLFFGRSGRVSRVHVQSGETVFADMPLAELDAQDLVYDVEDAQLQVELAQERLEEGKETRRFELQNAELELAVAQERLSLLRTQANVPAVELWIQEVRVQQAELTLQRLARGVDSQYELQLSRAQVTLRQAQSRLASTRLVAPFDGQVRFYDTLREGGAVSAYEPVAVVIQPDALRIEANLVTSDLETLYEGMAVAVELTSRPAVTTTGAIAILPQPFGSGTQSGTVIEFAGPDPSPLFRAGVMVTVRAELARAEDALWIPPAALHGFRDNYYVVVWEDENEREVPVRVGLQNDEQVQILDNLQAGQQLIAR